MDLKANACTCSPNKREIEQNTHQETTNMDEEHTPAHTHVDVQKKTEQNTHPWTRNMDGHHTPGTVNNFVF